MPLLLGLQHDLLLLQLELVVPVCLKAVAVLGISLNEL